ncbi:Tat pathway signal protein [Arthrobacter sp. YN]|uniref:SW-degrading-related protein 1 n=1 Tax=Arthrobacter sp. HW08 TaxID=681998 RepID=E9LUD9_9MICC|nr:Tat pathway signal protein [Arthrobacter sp. YN]ADW08976.1 SW-degrading-related protein 1 [Arthrobacter sp. HW08]ASN21222.1 Tat pathway signal protein [Arthrobacter sp. YN]
MGPKDSPDAAGNNGSSRDNNSDFGAGNNPPKPPPWQVPKPELHPELFTPVQENPQQDKPTRKSRKAPAGAGPSATGAPQPGQPLPVVDPFAKERERGEAEAAKKKKRSQRRTVVVGLGVTALLAGTITAIVASNEQEADYAQVCFNEETGERVEDNECNNSSSAGRSSAIYAWYFYSRGASVPAVGQNRSAYPAYTTTVPAGAKTATGYSTKGGTVSRGGFGSSSKSGGSSGG